jgi:ABC-type nitrate/sulfonate/bicarbonate transport system substrate-binding protein
MATMLEKKDVDAIVAWAPISDLVVVKGAGVYLAKQIDLWRKATGRQTGYPVHVCFLANPKFIEQHPAFPKDLNDAQKEVVDIWYHDKGRAIDLEAEVTKLPRNVVEYAYDQTVQVLSGLSEEQIDTLVLQLKLIKESGFLKSPIWENPEQVRKEFFWRG